MQSVKRPALPRVALASLVAGLALAALPAAAQQSPSPYPNMAPISEYRSADRDAEIALARSAAQPSVARDAEVLVLGAKGYEKAVPGKNGFTCMVGRSWAKPTDDPEFWNPKLRSPVCFNQAGMNSIVTSYLKKTEWVLAGVSREEVASKLKAAFDAGEFPPPSEGAIGFMMSKEQNLNDKAHHWRPHVMFYAPLTEVANWAPSLDDSPLLPVAVREEHFSVINVPVSAWSDGSPDTAR